MIKSNGGGCNAILVRGDAIVSHYRRRLCVVPERRFMHGVRLASGVWVCNLHATAHHDASAWRDGRLAARCALSWGGGEPVVLGGDFNLRSPAFSGFAWAGGHDVDHVFISGKGGWAPAPAVGPAAARGVVLERGPLSDHAPVLVTVGPR